MKSLSPSQPHAIIMVGIPGSGKSFFAEKFAETFHAPYISSQTIQEAGGITEVAAKDIALAVTKELFKTKQSVVIDTATDTRTDRAALARLAKNAGYEALFIWVQTDPATAKIRLTKQTKENPHAMNSEDYDRIVKRFTPPSPIEKPIVISGKHTFATQAKILLKHLSAPRATSPITSDADRRHPQSRRTLIR